MEAQSRYDERMAIEDEIRFGTFPEPTSPPSPKHLGNRKGRPGRRVNWKSVTVAFSAVALTFFCFQFLSGWQRPEVLGTGYGVGFDLTESYGTASLREPSGAILHLTHVSGNAGYQETMQRLGLNQSRLMSPPYDWWHDGGALSGLDDQPRQLLRKFRRAIGLPSSPSVGRISSLLAPLVAAAEHALSAHIGLQVRITNASISTPDLVALYDEDIADAATYVGLALQQDVYFARQPRHVDAAVLGYGVTEEAGREGEKRIVLGVYVSAEALSVEVNIKRSNRTCELEWAQHRGWFDGTLGIDGDADGNVEITDWWRRGASAMIRNCVESDVQNYYANGGADNVTDVLFMGPGTRYESVRDVFLDAVRAIQVEEPVARGGEDGMEMFVASQGAAEMAWRVANRPIPEGERWECSSEQRRKADSGLRYGESGG